MTRNKRYDVTQLRKWSRNLVDFIYFFKMVWADSCMPATQHCLNFPKSAKEGLANLAIIKFLKVAEGKREISWWTRTDHYEFLQRKHPWDQSLDYSPDSHTTFCKPFGSQNRIASVPRLTYSKIVRFAKNALQNGGKSPVTVGTRCHCPFKEVNSNAQGTLCLYFQWCMWA